MYKIPMLVDAKTPEEKLTVLAEQTAYLCGPFRSKADLYSAVRFTVKRDKEESDLINLSQVAWNTAVDSAFAKQRLM